jgi:predicted nucleic acid-binding protein
MEETLILDACCTLNLSATGRAAEIFQQLPCRSVVGARARGEAQWLAVPDSEEREPVDLGPLIASGGLTEVQLQGPDEERLFVEFGASLADGEAEAAAIAVNRGFILATDDRKARRIVSERYADVRLTGTLELLHEWQSTAGPMDAEVAEALRRIAERATYRPRRVHPLYDWWARLVEE